VAQFGPEDNEAMKKVWLIDDDEDMVRAVQMMLKLLDCESRFFYSARHAVDSLSAGEQPDLLVVDINMPEVTGIDLLEFLRRQEQWRQLPIVMLSTEAADVMVDRAMELGADAYVTKPVAIEELQQAMEKAFKAHENNPS
jgi:CheY-like chemotaxis protein